MGAPKIEAHSILRKLDEIPSLPSIVYELNKVISDPMSSTKDVEAIMSKDIGMTAKVLKLANSAYYAIPGGVSSLSRAIAFIGFDTVQQLVLSASIIKALDTQSGSTFDMKEFWKHSIGVAIASETIAKVLKFPNAGDLFTCGLVHDIGKIALHMAEPDSLAEIISLADKNKASFYEIEMQMGALDHTEIGKLLCEKWQLPKSILVCTKHHHEINLSKRSDLSAEFNKIIDIVSLANLLIHALKFGFSGHRKILGVANEHLARLMIAEKQMPFLLKTLKDQLELADDFIKTIGS